MNCTPFYCSVIVAASSVYVTLVPVRSQVRSGTFCRETPEKASSFVRRKDRVLSVLLQGNVFIYLAHRNSFMV